jgi:AcrR family transcriptional regulator
MASRLDPKSPVPSPFRSTRSNDAIRREKREALLLAAVRMFNERGFHATSLEDVAASLGVTKPVIYHYLGNKDQVLLACVRIGLAELQVVAERAQSAEGSGLDRLRAFLCRYAEVMMGDFGRCVIRVGEEGLSAESRSEFRSLKREIDDALRTMIAAAAADGSAAVPDVRIAALTFSGALNWPARWYSAEGPIRPGDMAAALVDTLVRGIEPRTDR